MFNKLSFVADLFYPDEYFASVLDIDFEKIYENGVRGLIFDIDNTIAPYDAFEVSKNVISLFEKLLQKGFSVCFLSNNKKKRVKHFCNLMNVHGFHTALKPTPFGIAKAMKYLNMPKNNLAIVGDQIFTDVLCGRLQNISTILVDPIVPQKDLLNKFKRKLELMILSRYKQAIEKGF